MLNTRKTLRMSSKEFKTLCGELGFELDDGDGFVVVSNRMAYKADSFFKIKEFIAYNDEIVMAIQGGNNENGLFFMFGENFGRPKRDGDYTDFAHVGFYRHALFPEIPEGNPWFTTFAEKGEVEEILSGKYQTRGFLGMSKEDLEEMDSTMDAFWWNYHKKTGE